MLNLEHLSKTYADGTRALSDINLTVHEGEIVSLIGGSGCGKTTLLRLIAGLDQASAGRIRLDDEVLSGPHPDVGIVFQEPRLLPWLSVSDNIAFGLDGQQQRVSIARAFVTNPKVLLLDEPFSALDAFTRASLHEHLLGLWEETRPTVVLVTHDVQEAVTLADRSIVMQPKPGRIFDELPLTLSRPRDKTGLPFETSVRRVLTALDHSLKAPQLQPQRERDRQAAALWW